MHAWSPDALLNSPFFEPLHPYIRALPTQDFPQLEDFNALLMQHPITTANNLPLQFAEQPHGKLPFELQYEPRCYLAGEVSTRRDNWHDLFNALVWFAFPLSKAAINQRHYHALTAVPDMRSERGVTRDFNTLFDESGVIVVSDQPDLLNLIREFRWTELFWSQRERVSQNMRFYIFGHGLHEKALVPYVGMTGQSILLNVQESFFGQTFFQQQAQVDRILADYLLQADLERQTCDLSPLPVLGIPDWWADNQQLSFYQNTQYFRAGRRQKLK